MNIERKKTDFSGFELCSRCKPEEKNPRGKRYNGRLF